MKVLHIVSSLDKSAGGPSRSVPQTCEQLAALGLEVVLIARPSRKPVNVNTLESFSVCFKSFFGLIRWGLKLSNNDTDLIHLQHVWDPYIHVMAQIARMKGIPYIITPRGMLEPWIMNQRPWKKQLGLFFYQRKDIERAALIHATCEMEKKNIRKLGFTNPIAVIPNGLELNKMPLSTKTYGSKKMVFLSRIHEKKGIELLLDAWKQLDKSDWELELAGEGDAGYLAKLKKKIVSEKISRVRFVGPQYEVAKQEFFKKADLFVLPSYSENFGMVVAEALSFGVPVITTTGTPWQELETYRCGWWIELSISNLAQALTRAMDCSPEELKEMGQRGRQLVEQNYEINKIAQRIKEVYWWVEGKMDKPDFVRLD